MLLLAQLGLAMFVKETFLLTHAQLSFTGTHLYKSTVSTGTEGVHLPHHLLLASYDHPPLESQETLGEGVVNINVNDLIPVLRVLLPLPKTLLFFPLFPLYRFGLFFCLDELPDIILRNVI